MELRQYLRIVRRWLWLLLIGVVFGGIIGYFTAASQTPVYQSSTKLLISSAPEVRSVEIRYTTDQQLAETYIQLMTMQPFLDAASLKVGYPVRAGQISATLIEDTKIVRVTVEDTDPQKAADIANALMVVLIEQNEILQASRFAVSEDSLKTQLEQVQSQINALQQEVFQVSDETLHQQQEEVQAQIDQLSAQILSLQQDISSPRPTQPATVTAATRVAVVGTAQPTVVSAEDQAWQQQKQFELEQAQQMLSFYQQIYTNLISETVNSSNSSSSLEQKQNNLALYQQIYSNLLSSYESVRLARLVNTPNVVQVEMATTASSPVRPRPFTSMGLGAAIGLLIAAAAVSLIEYLDDTIKTSDDVRRLMDLPVIGYIAEMRDRNADAKVYVAAEPRSPVSEAFRSLRTNLDFAGVDYPLHILLIVSANPHEGKTTVAVNLAAVIAQSGKRVLLVDADMRRPRIHRFLGTSNRQGLTDFFIKERTVQEIARPVKNSTLSVVTSGSLPPNPAELLGSERMLRFLEEAQAFAEVVIIDSPPFLVADASVLASRVDGVALVVQPGHTDNESAREMAEQVRRVGGKLVGVIFNRIPRNRADYYGGFRHYSPYYEESDYYAATRANERKIGQGNSRKSAVWKWLLGNRSQETDSNPARPESSTTVEPTSTETQAENQSNEHV
jgi:succinoglycan biosynthesis transport protein ExoP